MRILRALGLVFGLIAIRILMPAVFSGMEKTLLAFFDALQTVLSFSTATMQSQTAGVSFPEIPR